MANNEQNNHNMGGPPPVDDAWWMAVLDDVESRFNKKPPRQQKKAPIQKGEQSAPSPISENKVPSDLDWEWAREIYDQDQVLDLLVTGHNRGGLLVEGDRIQGFVPASHLIEKDHQQADNTAGADHLATYQGKTLRLKIIECNPERGRVVLSERAAQTDPGRRLELLSDLNEGDRLPGRVTTITDFGAFVDLGGMEGLVHISELSWGRVNHPAKVVSVGEQVEVCVLEIDRERSRVALSLKQLVPNPWETIETRYHVGDIVEAVITNVVTFGAFARLEPGLDGLIHASELGGNGYHSQHPSEIFTEGQRVQVRILLIDPHRQRLGLSLQTLNPDNAETP